MKPDIDLTRAPIGIFDSGVGGLSILQAVQAELPDEQLVFVADQAHVPYGPRPLREVRDFSEAITRFLLDQGAKLIVVACNAASAAALQYLRAQFPDIPFVGMEPAIKPAAINSNSKIVGVLATPATFQGKLYASVVERFAKDVVLLQHTCPDLVGQIEKGDLVGGETRAILQTALLPMLEQGIDTVVLGCTHYPFVIPLIQEICGPAVRVIDPAPAVARQVRRLLSASDRLHTSKKKKKPEISFFTTDDPQQFSNLLELLVGIQSPVNGLKWDEGRLVNLPG